MMKVLDLFSGVGGFSLGLERSGMETVAFCEIEPFCQKVLKKHWPNVPIYDDVRGLTNDRLRADGITGIDVITGGFPCQDISVAGNQAGIEGSRSGLWSEIARLIGEIQPRYAIMENVAALISGDSGRWFGRVLGDLAEIGYDAEWHCISASELGAHHHRDRVWIIAYPNSKECSRLPIRKEEKEIFSCCCGEDVANPAGEFKSVGINESKPKGSEETSSSRSECAGSGSGDSLHISNSNSERGCSGNTQRENAINAGEPPLGSRINTRGVEFWDFEPELGGGFDGFPSWLDRHIGKGMSYEESQRATSSLQNLWNNDVSKKIRRQAGGLGRVETAEVLLSVMREYKEGFDEAWLLLESKKAFEEKLRELRGDKEASSSPCGSGHNQQLPYKYSDPMQMVSRFPSFDSEEGWIISSWEDGIPRVANGIPDRLHRLKSLGNAVVPQIPEIIGRAIMGLNVMT